MHLVIRFAQWFFYLLLFTLPVASILLLIFSHRTRFKRIFAALTGLYVLLYIVCAPMFAFCGHSFRLSDLQAFHESLHVDREQLERLPLASEASYYRNSFTGRGEFSFGPSAYFSIDITVRRFVSPEAAQANLRQEYGNSYYYGMMKPFGAQSYEKDAFLLPVENMRDFIIPPLANTVRYSSSAAFRHEEYVVLIRESTADSHMRMMDALQAVRQVSPNLEDWLTHDFSFEQAADGVLHVQNHKEVEPELIPNI